MFGEIYNQGSAFERPKYGCLNTTLSTEGCVGAAAYGECYFVLKDMTCRWRTTLTNTDSCNADSVIGILSHCCHVLKKFATNDLQNLITVANKDKILKGDKDKDKDDENDKDKDKDKDDKDKDKTDNKGGVGKAAATSSYINPSAARNTQYYYREIQIHGPVRINVDIAELWIPIKYLNDKGIQNFAKKNGIELKIIGT